MLSQFQLISQQRGKIFGTCLLLLEAYAEVARSLLIESVKFVPITSFIF